MINSPLFLLNNKCDKREPIVEIETLGALSGTLDSVA